MKFIENIQKWCVFCGEPATHVALNTGFMGATFGCYCREHALQVYHDGEVNK